MVRQCLPDSEDRVTPSLTVVNFAMNFSQFFFFVCDFIRIFVEMCERPWSKLYSSYLLLHIKLLHTYYPIASEGRAWQLSGPWAQGPARLQSRCLLGCVLIWSPVRGRISAANLMQIFGRIHFLAVVGLRAPAACWLFPERRAQVLTATLNFFSQRPPLHGHLLQQASKQSL